MSRESPRAKDTLEGVAGMCRQYAYSLESIGESPSASGAVGRWGATWALEYLGLSVPPEFLDQIIPKPNR